jgi:transposase
LRHGFPSGDGHRRGR